MPRPPGIPDPRAPDSPTRVDDPEEDRRRSEVTVGEITVDKSVTIRVGEELPAELLLLPEIPPERLAALRRRRDELIPLLREFFGGRE